MMTNITLFSTLRDFLTEVNSSNSLNDKREVVKAYQCLTKLFNYVYDPYKKYHITVKQLDKRPDIITDEFIGEHSSIYDLLDMLTSREITGHAAIGTVNYFISNNVEYADLIKLIISKDLKCRVGASVINKIFPGTIPEFKVALADKYEDSMAPKMKWNEWGLMRKLNGVRCDIKIDEDSNARFYSRAGNEFTTLGVIAEEIKKCGAKNLVLDGEVCLIDDNGKDDFQAIVGLVKRKNYTIENPKFIVFDVLTHNEFDAGFGTTPFIDRLRRFNSDNNLRNSSTISQIRIQFLEDERHFLFLVKQAQEYGWEGSMLRRLNSPYQAKRTKDLLKVKQFHDAEYVVYDYEIGPFNVINKGTGLAEEIITLTNVLITHKGYKVSVGSGFKLDERKYYFEHPEEIIGAEITVQYFEETTNQLGGISLRFPTVKKIWPKGRDI